MGKRLPSNGQDLHSLLDHNFDKTLLALPCLGIFVFTVLPIFFMICVAFTNYDYNHQPPSQLFTWVGLENFKNLFSTGGEGYGSTFFTVLSWTLIWSFFATFLNYFLGMAVAILINQKGIKFKKLWRTILVMTIAVPQFVSLLYVGKMFAADGLVNSYLIRWGFISRAIPFWTNPLYSRILIIVINLWVGIPYTMLQVTGILQNIPAELYEASKMDGAGPVKTFFRITLPYMLFVTTPYLIASFVGNINNFNVIYLLSGGGPTYVGDTAGQTDLLVTWLYKLTVEQQYYNLGAVIGIMTFVILTIITLITYRNSSSYKNEEAFM